MVSKDLTFNLFGRDVNATASLRRVSSAAEDSTRSIKRSFGELPKYAAVATLGATAAAVKMAADFQQTSTRLVTDAGESAGHLAKVRDGMLNIAAATGTSAGEISSGMYLVESAGYHGAAGLKVMQAVAEGAKIGMADTKTVADALTTTLTDYGKAAGSPAQAMSMLTATVSTGKTNMEALAGSLHSVMPAAASAGISLKELLGAVGTMTGEGISADQATQNLNNAISSLSSPSQVAQKEMAQMGLSSLDVSKNLGKRGLTGTFELLSSAVVSHMGKSGLVIQSAMNQSKIAAASARTEMEHFPPSLKKLAGEFLNNTITQKEWTAGLKGLPVETANLGRQFATTAKHAHGFSDLLKGGGGVAQTYNAAMQKMTGGMTGLQVALHLTGDHMGTFKRNVDTIGKSTTEAGGHVRGWAETQKNFNQQLAQAGVAMQVVGIRLGTALLPALTGVARGFSGFFKDLQRGNPLAVALAAAVGIAAVALTGLYVTTKVYEGVTRAAAMATATFGFVQKTMAGETKLAAAAQWLFNAAMDANPIGLIVLAVAALIAVIVLLATHWKQVCAFIQTVWGAVCKWWADTMTAIGHLIGTVFAGISAVVTAVVSAVVGFVREHWQLLLAIFLGPLGLVIDFIATHFKAIVGVVSGIVNSIVGAVKVGIGWVSTFWQNEIRGWQTIIEAVWKVIGPFVTGAVNGIRSVITRDINAISSIWRAVWGGVSSFLSGVWKTIESAVSGAIGNVVGFFRPIASKIIAAIGNAGSMLLDIGRNIIQGLINGITSAAGGVFSTIRGIASNVTSIAKNIFGIHSPSTVFRDIGANIGQGLTNGLLGTTNQVAAATNRLADTVVGMFEKRTIGRHTETTALRELESGTKRLEAVAKRRATVEANLKKATATLTADMKARSGEAATVRGNVLQAGDITQMGSAGDIVQNLQGLVTRARRFKTVLTQLARKGIDQTTFNEIVNAGVDGGGLTTAEGLLANPIDLKEIVGLQKQLASAASGFGNMVATHDYAARVKTDQRHVAALTHQDRHLKAEQKTIAAHTVRQVGHTVHIHVNGTIVGDKHALAKHVHKAITEATRAGHLPKGAMTHT